MTIFLLIGITCLALYAAWRYRKAITAYNRFAHFIPPENHLSGNTDSRLLWRDAANSALTVSVDSRSVVDDSEFAKMVEPIVGSEPLDVDFLKKLSISGAAADGAIAGSFIADAALKIDPEVLLGLEFSTAQHLRGLDDIDSYIHAHFFSAPIASAEGWFERLTGYVAEQKAATALEQMGHHVDFAPVSNQPVWDLLVDGHHVQTKQGLAGAKDFVAAHHHGVDVFTGPEVAATIKDPSVHALDVLDKDSIHAATEQTLNGVDGVVDPGFHIPFITMAFSTWRESKLLWNEKTTFERALKNVGMDVVGVGVGALAGAKIGGAIGALFPGPGIVIGAIVGSIAGATGGKLTATAMRHAPFKTAREAYNSAVTEGQAAVELEMQQSRQFIANLQAQYQQRFVVDRKQAEDCARDGVSEIRRRFEDGLFSFCEQFPNYLRDLKSKLEREELDVLSRLPPRSILGWVFASKGELYRGVVNIWFARAKKLVNTEQHTYAEVAPRNLRTLYAEMQRFVKEYEFELDSFANELQRIAAERASAENQAEVVLGNAVAEVVRVRSNLIRELGQQVVPIHERIVAEIKSWNRTIGSRRTVLKREAATVGIDL
jgi:hypothetical protein